MVSWDRRDLIKNSTSFFTAYCLLPTAYCLLPTSLATRHTPYFSRELPENNDFGYDVWLLQGLLGQSFC